MLTLMTKRLAGRPINEGDLELLLMLFCDPRVMATFNLPDRQAVDRDHTRVNVDLMTNRWTTNHFGPFLFFQKSDNEFVGLCGLTTIDDGEAEVQYATRPEFWGAGLTTEASRAVIEDSFARLDAAAITASVWRDNEASCRVMEKSGFVGARNVEIHGLPHVVYKLTRDAWARQG